MIHKVTTKLQIENPLITCKKSATASQGKKIRRHYKIGQLAMFKEIIGVYRKNSWEKEMTRMEKNSGGFKCCSILWSN
jgi:hypothetical protein